MDIRGLFPAGGGLSGSHKLPWVWNPSKRTNNTDGDLQDILDRLEQNPVFELLENDSIICDVCGGKPFPISEIDQHTGVRDTTTQGNNVPK